MERVPTPELTNHGDEEILIDDGTAIVQIIFHLLDQAAEEACSGKYQNHARTRRRSSRTESIAKDGGDVSQ